MIVVAFLSFVFGMAFGFAMCYISYSLWKDNYIAIPSIVLILAGNAIGISISVLLVCLLER